MITAQVKTEWLAPSDVNSFDIAVFVDSQDQINEEIAIANKVTATQVDN